MCAHPRAKGMHPGYDHWRPCDTNGQNHEQFCTHRNCFAPPGVCQGAILYNCAQFAGASDRGLILPTTPLPTVSSANQRRGEARRSANRYKRRATVITSNRDFNEWRPVFANPLMASATMDRLVHRAVKIVIEGKSYRMDRFVRRSRELPQPSEDRNEAESVRKRGVVPETTSPAEGPYRPSWLDFSSGTGPKCAPKLADRAISAFLGVRHSLMSPRSAVLRHHRTMSRRTPRRSGLRRFQELSPARIRWHRVPEQGDQGRFNARPGLQPK